MWSWRSRENIEIYKHFCKMSHLKLVWGSFFDEKTKNNGEEIDETFYQKRNAKNKSKRI